MSRDEGPPWWRSCLSLKHDTQALFLLVTEIESAKIVIFQFFLIGSRKQETQGHSIQESWSGQYRPGGYTLVG
jgi:hypothetical protein